MLIANAEAIAKFLKRNRDVAKWMAGWTATTSAARWDNLADVRRTFPSADGVTIVGGLVITVFSVQGNSYRLLTRIDYRLQIVAIVDILTHAEYSKDAWKG